MLLICQATFLAVFPFGCSPLCHSLLPRQELIDDWVALEVSEAGDMQDGNDRHTIQDLAVHHHAEELGEGKKLGLDELGIVS